MRLLFEDGSGLASSPGSPTLPYLFSTHTREEGELGTQNHVRDVKRRTVVHRKTVIIGSVGERRVTYSLHPRTGVTALVFDRRSPAILPNLYLGLR